MTATAPVEHSTRPAPPSRWRSTLGMFATLAVLLVCIWAVRAPWSRLADAPGVLAGYLELMAQGVFDNPLVDPQQGYWSSAFEYMLESLQMAWVGTVIGAVLSFPLAFLAARTIAPAPVVAVVRMILNIIRAIPELIFAIAIMLPIFGFGPAAGALALGVSSVGTLGKLGSEAIEAVDPRPVEAVAATGANAFQVVWWGVVPQALPEILAFWLYRFEINIRASAILGVLGAGGIGAILSQLFQRREWERIGITLVVIVVVTVLVDQVSARIRHRIIAGPGGSESIRHRPGETVVG